MNEKNISIYLSIYLSQSVFISIFAQSAGDVEYTECPSAEG